MNHRYLNGYNRNEFWQDFRFFKLLVKYDFLHGLGETYHASYLLYWSLFETEALKFVVSILQKYHDAFYQKEFEFELVNYGPNYRYYSASPIWAAIRLRENEVKKLKVYLCFFMNKHSLIISFLSDLFPWHIIRRFGEI